MIREAVRQYAVALVVTAAIAVSLGLYLTARRGYFDLSIANKSLASTSLLLLGIVLLLGPLSRLYNRFDRWVNYRKELGILAFLVGAVHVYVSMFPLARSGPLGLYTGRPLVAYTGLAGLLIMAFLFVISFERIKSKLHADRWWQLQFRGVRLAALAVLTHMTLFKYSEWGVWLAGNPGTAAIPSFPPASLLVALFSAFVLLVRLSELLGQSAARILTPAWLILSLTVAGWLFIR